MTISAKQAKSTFLAEVENHIRETYGFLRGERPVYIFGSEKYGQFLARTLLEYGCIEKGQLKGFINDWRNGYNLEIGGLTLPVMAFEECDLKKDDGWVLVAMRERTGVMQRLGERGIRYFAGPLWEMESVVVSMLGIWHNPAEKDEVHSLLDRIDSFHGRDWPEKEMEGWWEDGASVAVLRNRLELYKTGRLELLREGCPNPTQEYFGAGVLQLGAEEHYVDCGAYTGDSVEAFVASTNGHYGSIVAFEPNPLTFPELQRKIVSLPRARAVEAATGNRNGTIRFTEGFSTGTAVSSSGTLDVREVRLDDFLTGPVTFVKMDIEGAELDTLQGMERILREQHPKLAVCLYHRVGHLMEVPKYLKSVMPEYRLKLRQHRATIYETVLYAEV